MILAAILHKDFFNYLIIGLFVCAMLRQAAALDWGQAVYFLGAIILNCAITFMMRS